MQYLSLESDIFLSDALSSIGRSMIQPIFSDYLPPHKWESKRRSCSIINTKIKKKTSHLQNNLLILETVVELIESSYVKFVESLLRKVQGRLRFLTQTADSQGHDLNDQGPEHRRQGPDFRTLWSDQDFKFDTITPM